jgi:hypothetical protein
VIAVDQLTFIVDLNETVDDDKLPVSMGYRLSHGTGRPGWPAGVPAVGEQVHLHCPDDHETFAGRVVEVEENGQLLVQVDWESARPELSFEWSTLGGFQQLALGPPKATTV